MIDYICSKRTILVTYSLYWTFLVPVSLPFLGMTDFFLLWISSIVPLTVTILANTNQIKYKLYSFRDIYLYLSLVVVSLNSIIFFYGLPFLFEDLIIVLVSIIFFILTWLVWYYFLSKFNQFLVLLPLAAIPYITNLLPGWITVDFDLVFSFALALSVIISVHTFFFSNRDATEKNSVVILALVIWVSWFALAFSFS
jgi:hypothetical protein